ncbi:MAG: TatD family hydrolase [Candidatus Nealsonbacteria bacterium]|nr:TatD family hydrolase [Candidatus Nealsonbacteria bacterium]
MLFDTHAHVNFNTYKEDSDEVIRRALDSGVWMINVGSQYSTSKRAVEMAERYKEGVYAAIGLHPLHLETGLVKIKDDPEEIQFKTVEEEFDYEKYKELAKSPKVVAIGEIGFDYYWKPKTKTKLGLFKEKQEATILRQIDLAQELDLPVIFHCRMAHDDLIEILNTRYNPDAQKGSGLRPPTLSVGASEDTKLNGVIHCFTGNWEQAQKYMDMGFYLAFNGLIFKMNLDDVIKKIPLDRLLIETDCPYLTPSPIEGRNEPAYVKYVAEKIAEIKGSSYEDVAKITVQNARKLFKI